MPLASDRTAPRTAPHREALATLVATALAGFLSAVGGASVNVALPAMGASLHTDAVTLSWVVTAFLLASATLLLPIGRVADLVGRRRVFVLGLSLWIVTGCATALAVTAPVLIALRLVQGAAGAMLFSTAVALVVAATPPTRRGVAIGVSIAAIYVGLAVGPPLGGFLTETFGWQSVFLVPAVSAVPALVLTLAVVKADAPGPRAERFDFVGSLVYTTSLAALLFGGTRVVTTTGVLLVFAGALGVVAFVLIERRVAAPMLDLRRVLANRIFVLSNLAAMIHYAATFAVGYFLSLYLQSVRGLGPRAAGLVLLVQPALMALLSPVAGRLSDRFEARVLASSGMALTTLALLALQQLGPRTPLAVVVGALVVLGIGFALFSSPNTHAVMSSVERDDLGVASATLGTMRVVGQALSMTLALLLVSLHVGPVQLGPETVAPFLAAMHRAFLVFVGAGAIAAAASLARGPRRAAPEPSA